MAPDLAETAIPSARPERTPRVRFGRFQRRCESNITVLRLASYSQFPAQGDAKALFCEGTIDFFPHPAQRSPVRYSEHFMKDAASGASRAGLCGSHFSPTSSLEALGIPKSLPCAVTAPGVRIRSTLICNGRDGRGRTVMIESLRRTALWINLPPAIFEGCDTLLDLGCGSSNSHTAQQSKYSIGLDGFLPYLRRARSRHTHDDVVLADLRRLPVRSKSVDCAFALDVIEHLTKVDGDRLLREMERIARKRVVVLTPNGFNPKSELENGNPLQAHLSGWVGQEFRQRGYRVSGRRGLRVCRGEHAEIRWRPRLLWGIVAYATQPLASLLRSL